MIHKFCGSEKRTEVATATKAYFPLVSPIPRPGWHLTKGAPKIGVRSTSAEIWRERHDRYCTSIGGARRMPVQSSRHPEGERLLRYRPASLPPFGPAV